MVEERWTLAQWNDEMDRMFSFYADPNPSQSKGKSMTLPLNEQSKTLDKTMSQLIAKSIRHAESVSRREHIKADRIERVNHFITDLRRELSYLGATNGVDEIQKTNLINGMCRKGIWYDVGHLTNLSMMYFQGMNAHDLIRWVNMARTSQLTTKIDEAHIHDDLEDLQRTLGGFDAIIDEVRSINDESEVVAASLCKLFE